MISTLTKAQAQIVNDTHRFRVVNCGRRFGKTTLAILEMVGKAASRNDCRVAYLANTYQQARDIAWRELKKLCQPITRNVNEARLEIEITSKQGGSSFIWLRGWESVETLRGQRFDFLVIDEVAMMRNFWENWQEVIRPTLTDTKGEVLFLSTPKGYNHFFDLYQLEHDDNDFKSFHFITRDNPYIDIEEINKAERELPEDRFSQEYLADFRKSQGLVYKEFNRNKHLFDIKPNSINQIVLGIDFGYTNPTAVLEIVRDYDNVYWVVSEWYKTGKTNIEIVEYAKSIKHYAVYADPAEPDRIEEMRRHGLNTREVSKEIISGIDKVHQLFKENRLKIHRACSNLINELETYSYPDKKSDKNDQELPVKENDHALDALRYAIFALEKVGYQRTTAIQWKPKIKERSLPLIQ